MIEEVRSPNEELYALVIRQDYNEAGVNFFTRPEMSQQIAFMRHASGKKITPHIHKAVKREVQFTQEVLVIRKGKLRVDFYTEEQSYFKSIDLKEKDLILLIKGGHGFEVLETVEMYEIKQGPYCGDEDKVRFSCTKSPEQEQDERFHPGKSTQTF